MERTCRQCSSPFSITEGDLLFYRKVSPLLNGQTFAVPPPALCPECRQRRRMSFRNERKLYRRKCDLTGQEIISVFSPESPHKVCEKNRWYSDAFDPLAYGRAFDFEQPFFTQFKKLALDVPLPSLRVELSENCEYNNDMRACANCYLCSRTHQSQNMLYTYRGTRSNDCVDCMQVTACAFLYECVECLSCQDSSYLCFCTGCANSSFLWDCRNCFDCFACCNLRNKQYCFFNEQFSKDEYLRRLKNFNLASREQTAASQQLYRKVLAGAVGRNLQITNCENVSGDNLENSKNLHFCFGAQGCEDGRYLWDVKLHRDAMDEYSGGRDSELMYETTSGSGSYDVQFCLRASDSRHVRYSFYITSSHDIFGCVGLRRAKHCILNRQYSASDYEALLPRVIEHMGKTGEWGEFFPAEASPFAYNETAAQEIFPLRQKEAESLGYRWLSDPVRPVKDQTYDLPDCIEAVPDAITSSVLVCGNCSGNFKIVPQELAFHHRQRLALPDNCPDCRHLKRLSMKNPSRLRRAACGHCGAQMLTTFPTGAAQRIYCQGCYLEQVR